VPGILVASSSDTLWQACHLNGDSHDMMRTRPRISRERRQQILEAATRVIAERGLVDTRIADVAEEAGASSALLIYYFDSKERLLTEALAYAEDRFYLEAFHRLTAIDSARERLIKLIEFSLPDGSDHERHDWVLWIELWARALRNGDAARKRRALDRRWRSTIADVVYYGQRNGEFRDIDAGDFAIQLASLLDGLAVQVILNDDEATPARVLDMCVEFAESRLGFQSRDLMSR
jgi:AcrR family transcriptional regulator